MNWSVDPEPKNDEFWLVLGMLLAVVLFNLLK